MRTGSGPLGCSAAVKPGLPPLVSPYVTSIQSPARSTPLVTVTSVWYAQRLGGPARASRVRFSYSSVEPSGTVQRISTSSREARAET